jgi:hypothetical protein
MNYDVQQDNFTLTKLFNMSGLVIPSGLGVNEHYCRRWIATDLLKTLHGRLGKGAPEAPILAAQRAHYLHSDEQYFQVSFARPLALSPNVLTSVTLGLLVDRGFQRAVKFWNDPAVPGAEVNLTCERCGLAPQDCAQRVVPPILHQEEESRASVARALEALREEGTPQGRRDAPHSVAGHEPLR